MNIKTKTHLGPKCCTRIEPPSQDGYAGSAPANATRVKLLAPSRASICRGKDRSCLPGCCVISNADIIFPNVAIMFKTSTPRAISTPTRQEDVRAWVSRTRHDDVRRGCSDLCAKLCLNPAVVNVKKKFPSLAGRNAANSWTKTAVTGSLRTANPGRRRRIPAVCDKEDGGNRVRSKNREQKSGEIPRRVILQESRISGMEDVRSVVVEGREATRMEVAVQEEASPPNSSEPHRSSKFAPPIPTQPLLCDLHTNVSQPTTTTSLPLSASPMHAEHSEKEEI